MAVINPSGPGLIGILKNLLASVFRIKQVSNNLVLSGVPTTPVLTINSTSYLGSGQPVLITQNVGSTVFQVTQIGSILGAQFSDNTGASLMNSSGIGLCASGIVEWGSGGFNGLAGAGDTALARSAPAVVRVTNGSTGSGTLLMGASQGAPTATLSSNYLIASSICGTIY